MTAYHLPELISVAALEYRSLVHGSTTRPSAAEGFATTKVQPYFHSRKSNLE